jgi:hypothetical protein
VSSREISGQPGDTLPLSCIYIQLQGDEEVVVSIGATLPKIIGLAFPLFG